MSSFWNCQTVLTQYQAVSKYNLYFNLYNLDEQAASAKYDIFRKINYVNWTKKVKKKA